MAASTESSSDARSLSSSVPVAAAASAAPLGADGLDERGLVRAAHSVELELDAGDVPEPRDGLGLELVDGLDVVALGDGDALERGVGLEGVDEGGVDGVDDDDAGVRAGVEELADVDVALAGGDDSAGVGGTSVPRPSSLSLTVSYWTTVPANSSRSA